MSEANEGRLHDKLEVALECIGNNTGIDADKSYVKQLSYHYYVMKARFYGLQLYSSITESARRDAVWRRIQEAHTKSGVTPERYMKAQFEYFQDMFGTVPKLSHLATDKAIERAQKFKGKTTGKVVSNAILYKPDLGAVFGRCEKQMREICKERELSRVDAYKFLIRVGMLSMLDSKFLALDPDYKKAVG